MKPSPTSIVIAGPPLDGLVAAAPRVVPAHDEWIYLQDQRSWDEHPGGSFWLRSRYMKLSGSEV